LLDKAKCTSSQQVQFNFFGYCSTFLPFAYEVEIETDKSIRRRLNLAALQAVIHAVVRGILLLFTKALVDVASVSSDPLSCLQIAGHTSWELFRMPSSIIRHPVTPGDDAQSPQERDFDRWRIAIHLVQRLREAGAKCELNNRDQTRN